VQEVHNINTSAGIPYPFNETIDSAAYLGFEKLADNGKYLADYIKVGLSSEYLFFAVYCLSVHYHCKRVNYTSHLVTFLNGTGCFMLEILSPI